jgi:hypothetical protein
VMNEKKLGRAGLMDFQALWGNFWSWLLHWFHRSSIHKMSQKCHTISPIWSI